MNDGMVMSMVNHWRHPRKRGVHVSCFGDLGGRERRLGQVIFVVARLLWRRAVRDLLHNAWTKRGWLRLAAWQR
jgi:hypothetical protein